MIEFRLRNPDGYREALSRMARAWKTLGSQWLRDESEGLPSLPPTHWSHPEAVRHHALRDWADVGAQERKGLRAVLDEHVVPWLGEQKSIHVLGAGTCGLAEVLIEDVRPARLLLSDLSWFSLRVGETMLEGGELPEELLEPLLVTDETTLDLRLEAPRYRPPLKTTLPCAFEVRDIFDSLEDDCEILMLPFVLDAFGGPWASNALIRAMQAVRDQRVIIIVTLTEDHPDLMGRTPRMIVQSLAAAGLAVEHRRITMAPYSFTPYGHGHRWTHWPTLIAVAHRTAAPAIHYLVEPSVLRAHLSDRAQRLLDALPATGPFEAIAETSDQLGYPPSEAELLTSSLTSMGALVLTPAS